METVCQEAIAEDTGATYEKIIYSEKAQQQLRESVVIQKKTITGRDCQPEILTRKEYLESLAQDPDHNFKISQNTIDEASAAFALEQQGLLKGPLSRKAGTDFVDIFGTEWNVKKAISKIPSNPKYTFNVDEFLAKIKNTFMRGENIIIDARELDKIY